MCGPPATLREQREDRWCSRDIEIQTDLETTPWLLYSRYLPRFLQLPADESIPRQSVRGMCGARGYNRGSCDEKGPEPHPLFLV